MTEKFPRCCECGSDVKLLAGPGRTCNMAYNFPVPIPDDFLLPTCVSCGEDFMVPERSTALYALLVPKTVTMLCERALQRAKGADFNGSLSDIGEALKLFHRSIQRSCK